ncbi:MAG: phage tail tip lysozyme [Bacillota bacterium]|nr:phage tail tip lysozyme [Bacillota bacterium]
MLKTQHAKRILAVALAAAMAVTVPAIALAASSNEPEVYGFLTRTMKLNRAAACGVMINLQAESGMKPDNLENLYNARFMLTDRQYTNRVSQGLHQNGRYKTGYGATRYFTTDYCGYGICQWTSLRRRQNLLKKAISRSVPIDNLPMQMDFLYDELKGSYPQVLTTLKGVPDTAEGAYLAAAHFCVAFEVPANTTRTAEARGEKALSGFWRAYSGQSIKKSKVSALGLCGYIYPVKIRKGKKLSCGGHVIGNSRIRSLTAKIIDSSGKAVFSKTTLPGSTVGRLSTAGNYMHFERLNTGNYLYVVSATDVKGRTVSAKHAFTVTNSGLTEWARGFSCWNGAAEFLTGSGPSALRITGAKVPQNLSRGRKFTIRGTVRSNVRLKKVTVGIYTTDGATRYQATTKTKKKTYNVRNLRKRIKFSKLPRGTYVYRVTAMDKKQTRVLIDQVFGVR